MRTFIVTGCGTDVGKTIVSAILTVAFGGDYWKPIESGESDANRVKQLIPPNRVHDPVYRFKAALSPHHAARLEGVSIDCERMMTPVSQRPLIIETAGGVLVPLNGRQLAIDLFSGWKATWIVVSRHYLGSINHTLLTLEALKQRKIQPHCLIFNGEPHRDSEEAIMHFSGVTQFCRLFPEEVFTPIIIKRYAKIWRKQLTHS